ncbi:hypothetical protein Pelo_15509 [Pelomyxa schiedti]|nr:hypothetical protein Pelo_15509 [Pelomyxa schiedti]
MWELVISCRAIVKRYRFSVLIVAPPGWRITPRHPTAEQVWNAGLNAKCCIAGTTTVATCNTCCLGKSMVHISTPKGPTVSTDGKEYFEFLKCRSRCTSSVEHIHSDLQLVVDNLPCGVLTSMPFKIFDRHHRPTKSSGPSSAKNLSPPTPFFVFTSHSNIPKHSRSLGSTPPTVDCSHSPASSEPQLYSPPKYKVHRANPIQDSSQQQQSHSLAHDDTLNCIKRLRTLAEMQEYCQSQEESCRKQIAAEVASSRKSLLSKSPITLYKRIPNELCITVRVTHWELPLDRVKVLWGGLVKTLTSSVPGFLVSRAHFANNGVTIGITAFLNADSAGHGAKVSFCYLRNSNPQIKSFLSLQHCSASQSQSQPQPQLPLPPAYASLSPLASSPQSHSPFSPPCFITSFPNPGIGAAPSPQPCSCISCTHRNDINTDVVEAGLCQFLCACTNL